MFNNPDYDSEFISLFGSDQDFYLYPAMIMRVPEEEGGNLLLRAYFGGCDRHKMFVLNAIKQANIYIYPKRIIFESLSYDTIRRSCASGGAFSEEDLSLWLSHSHIHLVACHPHQGTLLNWTASCLYINFQKYLRHHPGFPFDEEFKDPAFNQNKFSYLKALGDMAVPTVKIKFKDWFTSNDEDRLKILRRYNSMHFL
jgi:hypothetical protein